MEEMELLLDFHGRVGRREESAMARAVWGREMLLQFLGAKEEEQGRHGRELLRRHGQGGSAMRKLELEPWGREGSSLGHLLRHGRKQDAMTGGARGAGSLLVALLP
ncbi:hypothetical protein Zm00014a_035966 [Zea mays]|uniref:Uncharacterized protein n=1 Tax=Zea mays TaxID=4577 RepID=A0A3L6E9T4_MAIZE|nr:hypothetical protein Zm00014a_035966 [Zea mays]